MAKQAPSTNPSQQPLTREESARAVGSRRRAATQAIICDSAAQLFFERGYDPVTMEEIARAAGIRRSTLYLHFSDKEQLLGAIADAYTRKLRLVVARLPRPAPSRAEIRLWVDGFADFVAKEQSATELLVSLSHLPKAPPAAVAFGEELKFMMAERLDAFKQALEPGNTLALAWGISAMDGLGWALCYYARNGGNAIAKCRLEVAAEQLNTFVRGEFGHE